MALINNEKYSLIYQRMSLVYRRPEVRASLEVILSVFTITLLVFAAIRPTLTNIASLQKKIEDLDSVNKKADNKIAQIFSAQTQLDTFRDRLQLFDEAIPDGFSYSDITGRIEIEAKKYRLDLQTTSVPGTRLFGTGKAYGDWSQKLSVKDANNIIESGVTFTVSGSPAGVRLFLQEMENLDRVTLLNNVTFTTDPGPTRTISTLKATGQIYFYFYEGS